MKVLVVTGRLAQDLVRESSDGTDVLVLDVDIASFITPELLICAAPKGYDLILIPGAITADFRSAEAALGIKIRLGPKHAADLAYVLSHLDDCQLSRTVPACILLESRMRNDALKTIDRLEEVAKPAINIKGVKIGGNSRMKVLAEVVDATMLCDADLAGKISYYRSQGADMIDLGVSLDASPDQVVGALKAAREATSLPLSIDTVMPDLILAGLGAGADMILSLNGDNISLVGQAVARADVPAVIIPGPREVSLQENINAATALGIKVIADPVLKPPLQELASSIADYEEFRKTNPTMPIFFGVGNVTELLDADSQGTNALLAAFGAEVGASVLFTPEYSPKSRGSVGELRVASEMMLLAQWRRSPPKDLGIDLLVLKEKRYRPQEPPSDHCTLATAGYNYDMDPAGSFKIGISEGNILVRHHKLDVAGRCAEDILNTLIDMDLVTRLDHSGYLGRELEKAEIALRLGRSYTQDEPLFPEKC
jgi:dihydropteroate synthase-like protein